MGCCLGWKRHDSQRHDRMLHCFLWSELSLISPRGGGTPCKITQKSWRKKKECTGENSKDLVEMAPRKWQISVVCRGWTWPDILIVLSIIEPSIVSELCLEKSSPANWHWSSSFVLLQNQDKLNEKPLRMPRRMHQLHFLSTAVLKLADSQPLLQSGC